LTGVFIVSGTSAPTRCSRRNCDGGSFDQRLVIVISLLLVVVLVATSLVSSARIRLGTLPRFLRRWGVPGTSLCPGTFVRQAEKLCDIMDVMCGELFQHLLIPHTLVKCNYNRRIEDMKNGVMNLREPLNEGAQRFPRTLLHGMEIGLITRPRVCTLKVGCELTVQLMRRSERALRQVHEP
jgi:hypothetical protein